MTIKITSYGHLTWEWVKGIRSCVYPLLFHILYSIFPDSLLVRVYIPRIFQALLSALGDFFTYKLASELFGQRCGMWTVFNILASWFLFYSSSRTLTNMAEASLTACGLYFYPWEKDKGLGYLWFAGASVMMRPTAIVLWLPLFLWHVQRGKSVVSILKGTFKIGLVLLLGLLIADRWCYGYWIFTPYNFFLFNWTFDIGSFYGSHNILWNFAVGLPTVLGVHIVPFAIGFNLPQLKPFYYLIFWILIIFSIPSHKEFRFLLPIMHIALMTSSVVMYRISTNKLRVFGYEVNKTFNVILIAATLLVNIPLSIYMGLFHQRGSIDAALRLADLVTENSNVLFLMPCHSTPYYSYIHKNISMKFLTCEPNFENADGYTDEADEFFEDPMEWLTKTYDSNSNQLLPTHIVMFDKLYDSISIFLKKFHYEHCFNAFHSHFAEGNVGNFVYIFCK
ncbi:GPI mannosyltransferase 3-like isoform X2 [Stegodyphus dumicola]|uniref:GPI mannosyltransferase 3-like isoform X2 n=1 Tax=Stegodyphus dumicola TaxID=202533 RepID=UPI0015B09C4E|nr:GPI mannosyltransferase 3-like isoform X2 [Stegodyphus dumicola]